MAKPYKLNMTRPEFLTTFIADSDNHLYSISELREIIPASHDMIYCTYCALIEADIHKSDISYVNADADNSVVIKLRDKDIARKIKETCHKDTVRIGEKKYKLHVSQKGSHIFIEIKLTNPEVLENNIIQMDQYSEMSKDN